MELRDKSGGTLNHISIIFIKFEKKSGAKDFLLYAEMCKMFLIYDFASFDNLFF